MPQVNINIKSIVPAIVEKRKEQLQMLADKLDDNSLRILVDLANETDRINNKLADNELTLKAAIKNI